MVASQGSSNSGCAWTQRGGYSQMICVNLRNLRTNILVFWFLSGTDLSTAEARDHTGILSIRVVCESRFQVHREMMPSYIRSEVLNGR